MCMIGVSSDVAEPRSERSVGYHEGKCWGAAGESTERWQTDPNENHAYMVCGMTGCRKIMKDKESTRAEAGHARARVLDGTEWVFKAWGDKKNDTRKEKPCPDWRQGRRAFFPPPLSYPSLGCSPAEPNSVSPSHRRITEIAHDEKSALRPSSTNGWSCVGRTHSSRIEVEISPEKIGSRP